MNFASSPISGHSGLSGHYQKIHFSGHPSGLHDSHFLITPLCSRIGSQNGPVSRCYRKPSFRERASLEGMVAFYGYLPNSRGHCSSAALIPLLSMLAVGKGLSSPFYPHSPPTFSLSADKVNLPLIHLGTNSFSLAMLRNIHSPLFYAPSSFFCSPCFSELRLTSPPWLIQQSVSVSLPESQPGFLGSFQEMWL